MKTTLAIKMKLAMETALKIKATQALKTAQETMKTELASKLVTMETETNPKPPPNDSKIKRQAKKKQGFTLIETLVSIAIITIVITIVFINLTSSIRREDIRYYQGRINIENRISMMDSIVSSMSKDEMVIKTDFTLNDTGYVATINSNEEYVVNLNYYPIEVTSQAISLDYLNNLGYKPKSYELEVDKLKRDLPTIQLTDNLIYPGFYVRTGIDTETLETSIVYTFNKNIDTVEVLNIDNNLYTDNHLVKYLQKGNLKTMNLLYTTNDTVEFARTLNIMNKETYSK